MRILERTVYIGANVYARYPVIRLRIDLGPLEEWPSGRLGREFVDRLLAALPGLATHGCSYGTPGGFVRRLREDGGTWIGHILEHVTLELQHLSGASVTYGKTRSTGRPGEYYVVYAYEDAEIGLRAGEVAERLLRSLIPAELHGGPPDPTFDLADEVAGLRALAAARRLDGEPGAGGTTGEPFIVIVAGTEDASEVARLIVAELAARHASVGLADGVGAAAERAAIAAGHRAVVLATSRRLLLDTGLGTTRCDVAAVLGSLHGRRDPLQLPLEIATRYVQIESGSAAAAARRIAALLD